MQMPCGRYAHEYCWRYSMRDSLDRICPFCHCEMPFIVTESAWIPFCFLLFYISVGFLILSLRYNLFFDSYKIGD